MLWMTNLSSTIDFGILFIVMVKMNIKIIPMMVTHLFIRQRVPMKFGLVTMNLAVL